MLKVEKYSGYKELKFKKSVCKRNLILVSKDVFSLEKSDRNFRNFSRNYETVTEFSIVCICIQLAGM